MPSRLITVSQSPKRPRLLRRPITCFASTLGVHLALLQGCISTFGINTVSYPYSVYSNLLRTIRIGRVVLFLVQTVLLYVLFLGQLVLHTHS
jgi:hypothetical protein